MSDIKILRMALSDSGADAAAGVNLTAAEVIAKVEVGGAALNPKGGKCPWGICHDWSGNIYMSDSVRHVILKIEEGGRVSTVAGKAGTASNNSALQNVKATDARFNTPEGICCDKSGTLYVADAGNNQIRTIKGGLVNVLAGSGSQTAGFVDGDALHVSGTGTQALFDTPVDVAVDKSGTVYVSDNQNHAVRKIKANTVITVAGNNVIGDKIAPAPNPSSPNTWPSRMAMFSSPWEITCDPRGNVYVVDYGNRKIKRITQDGAVYHFSGSGALGRSLGTQNVITGKSKANTCSYHDIWDIDNDESGNVYVLDRVAATDENYQGSRLIKIDYEGNPSVIAEFGSTSFGGQGRVDYSGEVMSVICSPGQKIFVGLYLV